jgi:hypothetical protein
VASTDKGRKKQAKKAAQARLAATGLRLEQLLD